MNEKLKWIEFNEEEQKKFDIDKKCLVICEGIIELFNDSYYHEYGVKGITHWTPLPDIPSEEKRYVCAECGKKFKGIKMDLYANILCSDQCYEDYKWAKPEFPQDHGKYCRYKLEETEKFWKDGVIVGSANGKIIVLEKNSDLTLVKSCQISRYPLAFKNVVDLAWDNRKILHEMEKSK